MKRILFVGEHPLSPTGNGMMLRGVIGQLDKSQYLPVCFVQGTDSVDPTILAGVDYPVIPSETPSSVWGESKLVKTISELPDLYAVVMVGIDIWRYAVVFSHILNLMRVKRFRWISIFPYDLQTVRQDWLKLIRVVPEPYVYSQYGYNLLRPHVSVLKYYRPCLPNCDMYHPPNDIKKNSLRRKWFPRLSPTDFLFGFVGANQFRKDPQKMLDAFAIVSSKEERARLYFHTDLTDGVYNLERYAADTDIKDGTVFVKPSKYISQWEMIELYSCLDCYVNCSMQEGLSWTVIEAMACGVPVVATDTTAQTELVDECAVSVGMNVPSYLPVMTEVKRGVWDRSFVRTKSCDALLLAQGMMQVMGSEKTRNLLSVIGRDRAEEYFEGMSDINDVLRESAVKVVEKIDAVLFAQHSSAGDVLMSTQCFEGIKKRHPDKKLVYMTQRQYRDIVEGNPYIDEIIDWNVEKLGKYSIVYNPHGEHILPGGWNNLDVKLYDMYPYFCKVEAGEMFIECVDPEVDLPERHIVVHTTGGNVEYRTYEHMDIVVDGLGVKVVQVGGRGDMGVSCADVDLRGKLTWRETAYVMKHAVAAVVIDSFPAHLAGCLDTPVVVLFGPAPARVTAPKAHPDRLFCIEPDMLAVCKPLHHCWGDVREMQQKCTSPCINTINPMTVREALRRMMEVGA